MKLRTLFAGTLLISALATGSAVAQQPTGAASLSPTRPNAAAVELFDRAGQVSPRDVYKTAAELYAAGDVESARLLAMRVFLDGHRSSNLLDLLGVIEIKAGRTLLAGEWLRKALALNAEDGNARKLLARLPAAPRPIPMESSNLPDHFAGISRKLPLLLQRLTTPRQHYDAVLDEITRGQFYKALALAEEYEKRYPGIDGTSLTALCALYLGRIGDAEQLVTQGLTQAKHHSLFLFVKAMIQDLNPESSAPSRPRALYDLDRFDEALTAANAWSNAFPRSAEGLLVKARIALDRLQVPAAKAALDAASQRDPDHPEFGLLSSDLALLRRQPAAAAEALKRAARRGYHLPSVALANGLLLAATGQLEEARGILEEIETHQPFLDREAYPQFIRLAILVNQLPKARKALDGWKKRHPLNSRICFMEALYQNKSGQSAEGQAWLNRALELNPNNALGKALATGQAISIPAGNDQTAISATPSPTPTAAPPTALPPNPAPQPTAPSAPTTAAPQPADQPAPAAAPSAQPAPPTTPAPEPTSTVPGQRFNLEVGQGVPPETVEAVRVQIMTALAQVEALLGMQATPFSIGLVSTNGLGSRVAIFENETERLNLSMLCNDPPTIKAFLDGERPDLDEETRILMTQGIAQHLIAGGLAQAILYQKVKNLKTTLPAYRWIHAGVAEIAGGGDVMLKDILGSTQAFMASGTAKLLSIEGVNEALAPGNRDGIKLITARAQSYLMVAFLVKKGTNGADGFAKVVKLLGELATGQSFKNALKSAFGISESEFESGWKEAAFWSLKQGIPYEW